MANVTTRVVTAVARPLRGRESKVQGAREGTGSGEGRGALKLPTPQGPDLGGSINIRVTSTYGLRRLPGIT